MKSQRKSLALTLQASMAKMASKISSSSSSQQLSLSHSVLFSLSLGHECVYVCRRRKSETKGEQKGLCEMKGGREKETKERKNGGNGLLHMSFGRKEEIKV
jgi:hypothetical protein